MPFLLALENYSDDGALQLMFFLKWQTTIVLWQMRNQPRRNFMLNANFCCFHLSVDSFASSLFSISPL